MHSLFLSQLIERSLTMVDLHVHSTASDGTYTPTELVAYATEKN